MSSVGLGILLKYGGVLLSAVAAFAIVTLGLSPSGPLAKYYSRYVSYLERRLRMLFIFVPGSRIALGQAAALGVFLAVHAIVEVPFWYLFIVILAIAPMLWIDREHKDRSNKLDMQVDGFLVALANALKSTPNIGQALASCVNIIKDPIRQEVDLLLKEMKVGAALDTALISMAGRVGSRQLDAGITALLIGRTRGGDLSRVLESTAGSLREMQRLEGVVRTKTAEGRMQLWVLAFLPVGLVVGAGALIPGYFDPLQSSVTGYILTIVACGFWIMGIVMARKILAVNI